MYIKYLVSGKFGHPHRLRFNDIISGKEGEVAEVDDERGNFLIERGLAEEAEASGTVVDKTTLDSGVTEPVVEEPEVEVEVRSAETVEEPPQAEVKPKRRGRKPGQRKKN